MTDEKTTLAWIEKRKAKPVPRRRKTDGTCALHDVLHDGYDNCIDVIKATIKDAIKSWDHRFELLETKMQGYITKWALGVVASVIGFMTMIIIGIVGWQFVALRDDVRDIGAKMTTMNQTSLNSIHSLDMKVVELGTKQTAVIKFIEELVPEHERLMEHMQRDSDGPDRFHGMAADVVQKIKDKGK